jgi:hypothetical protein
MDVQQTYSKVGFTLGLGVGFRVDLANKYWGFGRVGPSTGWRGIHRRISSFSEVEFPVKKFIEVKYMPGYPRSAPRNLQDRATWLHFGYSPSTTVAFFVTRAVIEPPK